MASWGFEVADASCFEVTRRRLRRTSHLSRDSLGGWKSVDSRCLEEERVFGRGSWCLVGVSRCPRGSVERRAMKTGKGFVKTAKQAKEQDNGCNGSKIKASGTKA